MRDDHQGTETRVYAGGGFTVVPNAAVNDERLSFKARGLLTYMLGRPPGWRFNARQLAKVAPEGAEAIRSGLVELRRYGYYRVSRVGRGLDGVSMLTEIASDPGLMPPLPPGAAEVLPRQDSPGSGGPTPENPTPGNPDSGGPDSYVSTEVVSTEVVSTDEASPSSRRSSDAPEPERQDVEQVCQHVAQRMVENACKPPRITKEWRTEARRLLDLDQRSLPQVLAVIDWCWEHHFWRGKVQSTKKLRIQFDRLRLEMENEQRRGNVRHMPRRPATVGANYTEADNAAWYAPDAQVIL